MGYREIACKFWSPVSTIRHIVTTFVARGYSYRVLQSRFKLEKLPPRVRQALLTPELLQEWAPFTLWERR